MIGATDLRELLPSSNNPLVLRAVAWGKLKSNLKKIPLIPFGSRVLAHLPLKRQTALSGRTFPAIAVGRASGVKGSIKLFYQSTKRVIIRRTFKLIGQVDRDVSGIPGPIEIEISDDDGLYLLIYDMDISGVPRPPIDALSAESELFDSSSETARALPNTVSSSVTPPIIETKKPEVSKKPGVPRFYLELRSELQSS